VCHSNATPRSCIAKTRKTNQQANFFPWNTNVAIDFNSL
jgi:hypothetical protein